MERSGVFELVENITIWIMLDILLDTTLFLKCSVRYFFSCKVQNICVLLLYLISAYQSNISFSLVERGLGGGDRNLSLV